MKICVIYNYAQHYRLAIFQLLNNKFDCDFYFGNRMKDVKKLDYNSLPGYKKELKNIKLFSIIYWQKGAVSLFFKNYNKYIILGEYYCLSTWVLLLLCKLSKKKIYLWSHGWYGNETIVKRVTKKIFFSLSDDILLYGNYARNLMIKEGFKPDKLHVINNSLYYSDQIQIRKQLTISTIYSDYFRNGNPVILFIGRLTKEKDLDQLVQAWKILNEKYISVNLVFIGSGEVEEYIRKETLDNENVWFYGPCYDEQNISELIYNANVCVSPGNVGLTAIHSMVYGTPVITHNDFTKQMPEFEAIIPGKTGDYFIKDNIADLVNVIKKWISPLVQRDEVRRQCYNIIDEKYNPHFQMRIISDILK